MKRPFQELSRVDALSATESGEWFRPEESAKYSRLGSARAVDVVSVDTEEALGASSAGRSILIGNTEI
jgi:hypothetical protein